jgi:hypothetical protein
MRIRCLSPLTETGSREPDSTHLRYFSLPHGADLELKRGVHVSVKDLEADIMKFVAYHNENPKPYKWAKSADEILASVKRFCLKAEQKLCGEL